MISWKLEHWCVHAVEKIQYRPDRMAVYQELRQHLDDRCEDYLAQGLSNDEAIEKTLAGMGDPKELAVQLAAIHRPFWGYVYSIAKVLLIGILILSLVPFWRYTLHALDTYARSHAQEWENILDDPWLLSYTEPGTSANWDGYTFTVSRSAILADSSDENIRHLQLELHIRHPYLWSAAPDIAPWIWAQDDLGNIYPCNAEAIGKLYIYGRSESVSPLTTLYQMNIQEIPAACRWIDLHYNRDGRNLVLRISLTGGDTP